MFNFVSKASSYCWKLLKFCVGALLWVGFFAAITATSIFGFYFISGGVMAVFSVIAGITAIAFVVWLIGFIWKCVRLFFPKIEKLKPEDVAPA